MSDQYEQYEFDELEFFTVGTLGPKGRRVFYLQGRSNGQLLSLKIEKGQVAALAHYLDRVLNDLPPADDEPDEGSAADLDLREPVLAEFAVGDLAVAYASETDRLVIIAEELILPDDRDDDPEAVQAEGRRARFTLQREQAARWVVRAQQVVAAGRTPCEYCGQPMDPRHHGWCACNN